MTLTPQPMTRNDSDSSRNVGADVSRTFPNESSARTRNLQQEDLLSGWMQLLGRHQLCGLLLYARLGNDYA